MAKKAKTGGGEDDPPRRKVSPRKPPAPIADDDEDISSGAKFVSTEGKIAIDTCEEILRVIEEDVGERALDKAGDFFEGVETRTKAIMETVTRTGHATLNQQSALNNMLAAVNKWVH